MKRIVSFILILALMVPFSVVTFGQESVNKHNAEKYVIEIDKDKYIRNEDGSISTRNTEGSVTVVVEYSRAGGEAFDFYGESIGNLHYGVVGSVLFGSTTLKSVEWRLI